jgi:hypothetical protein
METLSFEQFRDFLKSLTRDQVREIQQLLQDASYQQAGGGQSGEVGEQPQS